LWKSEICFCSLLKRLKPFLFVYHFSSLLFNTILFAVLMNIFYGIKNGWAE
jgi:hypothetical protein